MTLKQAFKEWSVAPRNMALANRYRVAVNSVLMKRYAETELCMIGEEFARNIFACSDVAQELKTRAASILVSLLQWGGDHGHCGRPTFDFTIAIRQEADDKASKRCGGDKKGGSSRWIATTPRKTKEKKERGQLDDQNREAAVLQQQPQLELSPESPSELSNTATERKPESDSESGNKQIPELESEISNEKTERISESPSEFGNVPQAKPARRKTKDDDLICQLSPKTLKVVKTWPNPFRVKEETGVGNVKRAIENCGLAGGYYWSYRRDVDTFRVRLEEKRRKISEIRRATSAKMREAKAKAFASNAEAPQGTKKLPNPTHFVQSKEDIWESLRIKGPQTADEPDHEPLLRKITLPLAVFTDKELFDELERRGWIGCFSKTKVITIGNNKS